MVIAFSSNYSLPVFFGTSTLETVEDDGTLELFIITGEDLLDSTGPGFAAPLRPSLSSRWKSLRKLFLSLTCGLAEGVDRVVFVADERPAVENDLEVVGRFGSIWGAVCVGRSASGCGAGILLALRALSFGGTGGGLEASRSCSI